ncbi:hypothetical protein E2562_026364 [Oryza meyeriana var. granulata]|uniref:Uncharacterized protein n=1 Tax=Oryza meyeriana var. granulata TaxID=110450 RepID=A0A6G1EZ36_9ORYZ|nr:hypothetical protein E2562_026364 [Oryza meyeriana var. granulata]
MRVALEVWTTGAKRGKGAASSGGMKKVPVSSAKRGKRALNVSVSTEWREDSISNVSVIWIFIFIEQVIVFRFRHRYCNSMLNNRSINSSPVKARPTPSCHIFILLSNIHIFHSYNN